MAHVGEVVVPVRATITVGAEGVALEDRELFAVLRRKADLKQTDVAAAAGVRQSTVSRWERGRKPFPEETVSRMWEALLRLSSEAAA